jgi:hypothetical protein
MQPNITIKHGSTLSYLVLYSSRYSFEITVLIAALIVVAFNFLLAQQHTNAVQDEIQRLQLSLQDSWLEYELTRLEIESIANFRELR